MQCDICGRATCNISVLRFGIQMIHTFVSGLPTCPQTHKSGTSSNTRKLGVALLRPGVRSRASAPVIVYGPERFRVQSVEEIISSLRCANHLPSIFSHVSSLLVSLFYSSAGSCRGSGPCALAPPISRTRTLYWNSVRVTVSPMLHLNVRSKPAAVGVCSTFLCLRFPFCFYMKSEKSN